MFESVKLSSSGDGAPAKPPDVEGAVAIEMSGDNEGYFRKGYESDSVYRKVAKGLHSWKAAALVNGAIALLLGTSFVWLALTAQFQMHIVRVNELGQVLSVTPVEEVKEVPDATMVHTFELFISNARAVYDDPHAQEQAVQRAFAFLTPEMQEWLNEYNGRAENDPRNLSSRFSRTAEVQSVVRYPDSDTYEVQWTETKHFPQREERSVWKGVFSVVQEPPSNVGEASVNAYGTLIDDISISRITNNP